MLFDEYGVTFKSCWVYRRAIKYFSCSRLVAVFPHAAIGVGVVGLGAFTLDTGAIHLSNATQLAARVTPAAQT